MKLIFWALVFSCMNLPVLGRLGPGRLGPGRLGPGDVWARGTFGPRRRLGPGDVWAQGTFGPYILELDMGFVCEKSKCFCLLK